MLRLLSILLLLLVLPCRAQLIGTDPVPNAPGKVTLSYTHIGSNGELVFDRGGRASIRQGQEVDINSLRFIIGLVDNLDLTITTGEGIIARENGSRFTSPSFGHGADDSQIRFRYAFVHEDDLHISLLSTTTIPTGGITSEDRLGLGQGFVAQTMTITARQDFDRFQLWTEGYYSFPITGLKGANTVLGTNLALGYLIGDTVEPSIEFSYVSIHPGDIKELSYTLACTIFATEHFMLQGGVQQVFSGVNTAKVQRPLIRLIYNF